MSNALFGKTEDSLAASIQMRLLRQNVVSSNIANAETPGYKAKKLDFEEALRRAIDINGAGKMHSSHNEHYPVNGGSISRVRADIYDNPDVNINPDGNTVDLEKEMAKLSENSILYKAALELINKKMSMMRYAVSEGGR